MRVQLYDGSRHIKGVTNMTSNITEEKGNKMEHLYKSFELKADENGMIASEAPW